MNSVLPGEIVQGCQRRMPKRFPHCRRARPGPRTWALTPFLPTHRRTIVKRLAAAGKLEAAEAAIAASSAETRWLWNTVDDVGGVFSDDARSVALLEAIGADPVAILAPENEPAL